MQARSKKFLDWFFKPELDTLLWTWLLQNTFFQAYLRRLENHEALSWCRHFFILEQRLPHSWQTLDVSCLHQSMLCRVCLLTTSAVISWVQLPIHREISTGACYAASNVTLHILPPLSLKCTVNPAQPLLQQWRCWHIFFLNAGMTVVVNVNSWHSNECEMQCQW